MSFEERDAKARWPSDISLIRGYNSSGVRTSVDTDLSYPERNISAKSTPTGRWYQMNHARIPFLSKYFTNFEQFSQISENIWRFKILTNWKYQENVVKFLRNQIIIGAKIEFHSKIETEHTKFQTQNPKTNVDRLRYSRERAVQSLLIHTCTTLPPS